MPPLFRRFTSSWPLLAFLALLGLLTLVYLPTLPAPLFSVDDFELLQIPQIQKAFAPASIASVFKFDSNIDYYPVRDLSYMVDAWLWPTSTIWPRIHQLILFSGCGVLFAWILTELGTSIPVALGFAGIWALHPYHAEMVVWISGRKDLLALFFALGSTYAFIRAIRTSRASFAVASLGLFLLSLLSKASFSLLPIAGLFGALIGIPELRTRRALYILWPGAVLALASSLGQKWFYTHVNDMRNLLPLGERLRTSVIALARMGGGWIWPAWNIVDETTGEWARLNSGVLPLGIGIWTGGVVFAWLALFRRNRPALAGLILVFALYLPISGLLFPHRGFYSTRYLEPSALALFVLVGLAFGRSRIPEKQKWAVILPLFALSFGAVVFEADHWSDGIEIRLKALRQQPESVSLKSYLWGELVGEAQNHPLEPGLASLQKTLESDLDSRCQFLASSVTHPEPALANCLAYFRNAYYLNRRKGKQSEANQYLEMFRRANLMFDPPPRMLDRLELENLLFTGQVDANRMRFWQEQNPYYPNPDYRSLRLITDCLLGREPEASSRFERYLQENLLTKVLLRQYLHETVNANLQPKLLACLKKS